MFLRFVLSAVHAASNRKTGLLVAAADLRDAGALSRHHDNRVFEIRSWFIEHLQNPKCLAEESNARALSWFKSSAKAPISQMWELAAILESHGTHIELLKTEDPGSIIYEDEWQVVAKPRRGQRLPW